MVPIRRRERQLRFPLSLLREQVLEVVPLVHVRGSDVLDLPRAEHGFARLVALFEEGGDVGDVGAEDVGGDVGDLGEAFEAGEEGAPVEPNVSRYS